MLEKRIIHTKNAPQAIGPYNQAVQAGDMLYLSGQIAIQPSTGELVCENIRSETRQVMENLGAVLKAAGLDFEHVVKSSLFLRDMNDYAQINEVYSSCFDSKTAPAREAVEVSRLPKNVNVEISMIALCP